MDQTKKICVIGWYFFEDFYKHLVGKKNVFIVAHKYDQILDDFNASKKRSIECIRHLESMGFSYGQSKTAVYKYRVSRNLIGKRY